MKLLYIVTHPMTAMYLLKGQLSYMRAQGAQTYLITSPGKDLEEISNREQVAILPIPIEREIHILKDFASLLRLIKQVRQLKPDIVNASTPKAGLLGMIAARIARVPVRIYLLRGLRLETKKGFFRRILKWTETITSSCANQIVCVSNSLKRRYLEFGLAQDSKMLVLGAGSSNGIDAARFPQKQDRGSIDALRESLKIPDGSAVIGFVGRLTHDKGLRELLESFDIVSLSYPNVVLLILGDFESGDPLSKESIAELNSNTRIIRCGFVKDTTAYYPLMDILAFPSYREGFPNAPLEAAMNSIPAVGFAVTGTVDAIEDGITGKIVPAFDVQEFARAIVEYIANPAKRNEHGAAARKRAVTQFSQELVWARWWNLYRESIAAIQSKTKAD